jgi:hypothetical protein
MLTYDAGAPVATVLENTIGNVWFNYDEVGSYILNSAGLFTINKTVKYINTLNPEEGNVWVENTQNVDSVYLGTSDSSFTRTNSLLYITPIEIRVYN